MAKDVNTGSAFQALDFALNLRPCVRQNYLPQRGALRVVRGNNGRSVCCTTHPNTGYLATRVSK